MPSREEQSPTPTLYLLLIAVSAGAALLGFAREATIGALFGATRGTDAFYAALTIPFTAAYFLVGGALAPALTTALARRLAADDPDGARALLGRALQSMALWGGAAALALALAAPRVAGLLVPGFDEEGRSLTARLLRLLVVYGLLTSFGQLVSGALIAAGAYRTPPIAVLASNAVSFGMILLMPGPPRIETAAWALNAGSVVFLLALLPRAISLRLAPSRVAARVEVPWREAVALTVSLCAAGAVDLAERPFASKAGVGAIAVLAFASKLVHLPMRLFAAPLASVAFPRLARRRMRVTAGEPDEAGQTATWALRLLLYAGALTAGAAAPLAAITFGRGRFDAAALASLASALTLLAPAIVFIGFIEVASKYLLASGRAPAVAWAQGAGLLAYLVTVPFLRSFGVPGLVVARDIAWGIAAAGLALPLLIPGGTLHPFRRFPVSLMAAGAAFYLAMLGARIGAGMNLLACILAALFSAAMFCLVMGGDALFLIWRRAQRIER